MVYSRVPVTTGVTATGSTVSATREVGEPALASGAHSVWYSWTPSATRTYIVSTSGSSFDTLLAVYVDNSNTLTGLTLVRSPHADFAVVETGASTQQAGSIT
jgi:hypothetical protein